MENGNYDPELAGLLEDIDEDIGLQDSTETPTAASQASAPSAPVQVSSDFLKKVIAGEQTEYVPKLLDQLDKAINTPLKEDKALYRQRLIATYWNFLTGLAEKINNNLSTEKLFCIRYGIVDMNLLSSEQQQLIKSIPFQSPVSKNDYPFYYFDEWLKNVSAGQVKASMVDEVAAKKKGSSDAAKEKLDRKYDSRNAELIIFKNKADERALIEKSLAGEVNILLNHMSLSEFNNLPDAYTPQQKEVINRITDDLRKLKNIDLQILGVIRNLRSIDSDIQALQGQAGAGGSVVDSKVIIDEYNSIRQMIKMCVGPRGNHFPILIRDYAPTNLEYVCTKENVIKVVTEIEKRDASVFIREFKQQTNRIVPYIIIVPAYGEKGICWEPFDTAQRATSRGRIAVPLYVRMPLMAILNAVADLRWQVAKEKASYRWMEEGLTGKYYNYFTENKLRGNIKDEFVNDYIIWITQEWNGTQKLHRDVREIFWRHMPFPQVKKDELKNRGFFYNDLYKKDTRRAMSDGY